MGLENIAYIWVQQIKLDDDHHKVEVGKAIAQEKVPDHIRQDHLGILGAVKIVVQDQAVKDSPQEIGQQYPAETLAIELGYGEQAISEVALEQQES